MTAIEIARRLASMDQPEGAIKAYGLAIHESAGQDPAAELEGALYILQNGGDYKVSYSTLIDLHRRGCFQADCLSVMTQAFYEPNIRLLKTRYQNNCKLLKKYPYLFRKDFPDFEFLPIRFYPYDDNCFVPYDVWEERFGAYMDFKKPVVSRNFFRDLENPILAKDVYSQYELEYLNDNVRKSEFVGRENHIYLHYTDWGTFCAYLQCLNMRPLLEEKKIVFLIGEEAEQYPIDFKERFGIDYSQYPLKPVGIREVKKLIWHVQLSSHNGGDFFNEIMDGHPNLLSMPSIMMENITEAIGELKKLLEKAGAKGQVNTAGLAPDMARIVQELCSLRDSTDKDLLVAVFLSDSRAAVGRDPAARIAPALFFQPHFFNMNHRLTVDKQGRSVLRSKEYDTLRTSPMFRGFRYIKTFTPMRRITNSYGAAVRFMVNESIKSQPAGSDEKILVAADELTGRVLNRSYLIDPRDRLYADSILVRFEDGKLNPKATFTALAAFLDIPYTESMTYCSLYGERDPESLEGNDLGFSTAAIYRTYDEYADDAERTFLEYFMRDAYEAYGYDFHYYDGQPVDEARAHQWVNDCATLERYIRASWKEKVLPTASIRRGEEEITGPEAETARAEALERYMKGQREHWHFVAETLLRGLRFVNRRGQPLHMMPRLELDPALLEQPLYH